VVWPLAGFGGTGAAVALPFSLTCIVLALLMRPAVSRRDLPIAAAIVVVAAQVMPLPRWLAALISPRADDVRGALALAGSAPRFAPLTIDNSSTLWALAVLAAAVAIFLIARASFAGGGVRRMVRMIAGVGLVVSLFAIVQAATAGRRIYWLFPTEFEGPLPFGPFVNRNHFATWAIMAIPLCVGYLAARSGRSERVPYYVAWRRRVALAIDPRSTWLVAAVVVMVAALLLSLSRSGVVALAAATVITGVVFGPRMERRARRVALAMLVGVTLLGAGWADLPQLRARFAGTSSGVANRLTIWRATAPVITDFWLAGTGAGTYGRAMLVYQRADRGLMFNQAHNHYLQVTAEGGVLLAGAVLIGLGWLVRTGRERCRDDASALLWIRAGAACGLLAVAMQSVWETGLVMPANAALAAVLAAVITVEKAS
jgi:O-antigen ligase